MGETIKPIDGVKTIYLIGKTGNVELHLSCDDYSYFIRTFTHSKEHGRVEIESTKTSFQHIKDHVKDLKGD